MSDFNTNFSNQNQYAPQQQAQGQNRNQFGGYGVAQSNQPQPYGAMNNGAQGQYAPYAQQGVASHGQGKTINLNIEFDQGEAVPEVPFAGLPYITSSGVYRLNIREARFSENADGSASIRFAGVGVSLSDPSYQGRLHFSSWVPNGSTSSRGGGAFESIIKVTGNYHMHGNKCVPDLVYEEVAAPTFTYKELTGFIGQDIVVVVRASSKCDRKGVPFFNLVFAFHSDLLSSLEKQKGETIPRFIKEFLEPTGRYYIASEHRPLLYPQAETSAVPYEYNQASTTNAQYGQTAQYSQSAPYGQSAQYGQAPQAQTAQYMQPNQPAQYGVPGQNTNQYPQPQGGAQFNQSQYAGAQPTQNQAQAQFGRAGSTSAPQGTQAQGAQQTQSRTGNNVPDVGPAPDDLAF